VVTQAPRLSHQFPVELVVTLTEVAALVVVWTDVVVDVVDNIGVEVVADVWVGIEVEPVVLEHEVRTIEVIIKQLSAIIKTLFFNLCLHFSLIAHRYHISSDVIRCLTLITEVKI